MTGFQLLLLFGLGAFAATYALLRLTRQDRPDGAGTDAPMSPAQQLPPGMVRIPGGAFTMGSDAPDASSHEHPAHRVRVDGFWMDQTDVTKAQFRAFVEATSYVTTTEKAPSAEEILRYARAGVWLSTPPARRTASTRGSGRRSACNAAGRSSVASATTSTSGPAPA
jgi:formylglycine-generating enzyme required for sulfatase activity